MNVKFSLKACRVNAKLSQRDMCAKLGISPNTFCNWENGKTKLQKYQLELLSNIYGIPTELIFLPYELDLNEI